MDGTGPTRHISAPLIDSATAATRSPPPADFIHVQDTAPTRHLDGGALAPVCTGRCLCAGGTGRASGRAGIRQIALPVDRPGHDVGSYFRSRHLRGQPGDLVCRDRSRRRVEDDQQRRDVHAALSGSGTDRDRGCGRVADQSGSRVGRHRRIEQSAEHVVGQWHLQVDRWRYDVHVDGATAVEAHQSHRHASYQQRRGAGGIDWSAVRPRW